ncbi:ATP-binding cassette domain-containing protein [Pseudonocardia sp. RS11V-5]|uniref:ATP-binding cassette domain-containing protein n=1 Tax=Pseudonocardia terrae TaxID=2905831 RepID=UPI001E57AC64|nr:ATP-binding cassette domain-containing protein [Pseudonocardia terrae]MCE3554459.1 ATP-binding cassette domain-containing protein [Pseudonocardia terrae]
MPGSVGPAVELAGVTTVRDDAVVLLDLCLRVRPGEVTVLIGPSGAGKTTLVRHVVGLLRPDTGTVRFGGTDVWAAAPDELRRIRHGLGVMLGGATLYDTSLFASMTAADNVRAGLAERGVDAETRDRRCARLLQDLDLLPWTTALPADMPAHARRRLALARALAAEAPLLVLDDVEAAEEDGRDAVAAAVHAYRERTGATILVTTHDLTLARELGGTLAVLWHGRIVGEGPAHALLHGIDDAHTLEARFGTGDVQGPPTLEQARRAIGAARSGPRRIEFDQRTVFVVLAALIAVAALGALYLAGPPG